MRISTYNFTIEDNRAYVIEENGHAILVDAPSTDLTAIIKEQGINLDYIFLTHEHCDHLWGLNEIRTVFNPMVIATKAASISIGNARTNRACVHHIYITVRFGAEQSKNCTPDPQMICDRADIEYEDTYNIEWMGHELAFYATPGHSRGSGMLLVDGKHLFSGDTMIKGQQVFTMFETGDMEMFKKETFPLIKSFSGKVTVYPGHGDGFSLQDYDLKDG